VSATVPVLVMKTRQRAIGGLSVQLGAQSAPLIGWVGSHELWVGSVQIWSSAAIAAPGGGVAGATVAIAGAEVTEVTGDAGAGGSPVAMTVCVRVAVGVTLVVWHTYSSDAPAAKEFPGTGTGPPQSVGEVPEFGSELLTLMLVSGSVPVLVTSTRHHAVEPYHVADGAQ
jgi:hypothetical protein